MSKHVPARWAKPGIQVLGAFLLAALVWLAVPQAAQADWSLVGDTVPAGQVIDNDVLARGTDVVIDGTINGDLLAIGSNVTVNGSVSGSLVVAARNVTVNGQVDGSIYTLARTLKLGAPAYVANNVHFAGLLLDSQAGSRIGRDLVAASVRGRISSEIGRTLNAVILLLTFNGRIGAGVDTPGVEVPAAGAALPSQADPGGVLLFIGSSAGKPLGLAAPALDSLSLQQGQAAGAVSGIPEWIVARLGDLAVLLLVGGLAVWLRPVLVRRPAERLRRKPLPAAGLGLLALTIAINALAVAILLGVLLFVVGLWLGGVTLWGLAFLLWGIGYPALILGFALFALMVLYGSKAIVADMIGTLILKRLAPQALEYRVLPLLLGLVLYVALRSIPMLGWATEVIVTIFGLGAIWLALRDQRSAEDQSPVPAESAKPEGQTHE
jgi:cytoskeletal protein CcmA (bactofilin family)